MPKIRRPNLPQSRWETHKESIRQLYLIEKRSLEGEHGVIEIMKDHGLYARYSKKPGNMIHNLDSKADFQPVNHNMKRSLNIGAFGRI